MSKLIKKRRPSNPVLLHRKWNTCFIQRGASSSKPFKCIDCEFTAKSKVEVQRHYGVHFHEEPFACDFPHCRFRTRLQSSIFTHKKRHEREDKGEMPFECDYPGCDFKTGLKSSLKTHRVGMHETKGKPFPCSFSGCKFRAKSKSYVQKHEQTHDPNRPKPFKCAICRESFYINGHLQVHIMTHTKEGAHKCPHCSYSAPFLSRVNRHVRNKHPPSDGDNKIWKKRSPAKGKQHKCSICEFSSDYISKLNKHLVKVHRPKVETVKKRVIPFACETCDFHTNAMSKLVEHLLLHSKSKPYSCTVRGCDFRTKWKGNLKPHLNKMHPSEDSGDEEY